MTIQNTWLLNLLALVEAEGGGRRGIRAVADASGLAEEYVYQLVERKVSARGKPHNIGKVAAQKIARAFAGGRDEAWFNNPPATPGAAPALPMAPVQLSPARLELSPDAFYIAQWFDKIPDGLARLEAFNACNTAILNALQKQLPTPVPVLPDAVKTCGEISPAGPAADKTQPMPKTGHHAR